MRASRTRGRHRLEGLWLFGGLLVCTGAAVALQPVPTTQQDFFAPGTQPRGLDSALLSVTNCANCHTTEDDAQAPFTRWAASMMAQASRDPIFLACLDIAQQDADFAGEFCLRCHSPVGWLNGNSIPPDGSAMSGIELQGVACHVCHRMVNPAQQGPTDPPDDEEIISALSDAGLLPVNPNSANYVLDPQDRRRGPYDLDADWIATGEHPGGFTQFHQWRQSPFHRSSELCATCHDISSPLYERQGDRYALIPDSLGQPHSSHDKNDQFPIERLYSEWQQSDFAQGPIDLEGRFGGNNPLVSSCQDCHMQDTSGYGCEIDNPPLRHDLPQHNFNGVNSWVLGAIRATYFDSETFLSEASVDDSIERNKEMLRRASDLEIFVGDQTLTTRVVNYSGHKLPSGYSEGRRVWVNVQYFDGQGALIDERGHYDYSTAELTTDDTKVYEGEYGIDAEAIAELEEELGTTVDFQPGPGFHFALNNKIFFDNRIPPMGFTNAGFEQVQAAPVAYDYQDGQYWDDTVFEIPFGAAVAEVRVFHQTTTKEYIEFLRDENDESVNDPENPSSGEIAYDLWEAFGKSEPVEMDSLRVSIACPCDFDTDGAIVMSDLLDFLDEWFAQTARANINGDTRVSILDLLEFLDCYFECSPG